MLRKSSVFLVGAIIVLISTSCSDKDENKIRTPEEESELKATQFEAFILNKGFRPVAFYSDKPIDYFEDDNEVKSETDLWSHVKPHIRDDKNTFTLPNLITVEQNKDKIAGIDSAILKRNWKITHSRAGVFLDFIDFNYVPRSYKLQEFTNNTFTIYLNWTSRDRATSATLFTKYQLLP